VYNCDDQSCHQSATCNPFLPVNFLSILHIDGACCDLIL